MPSEQAIGRPVYATDIYSLGLTAIYLLTGKQPQEFETHPQTGQILWQQYAAGISPEMVQILTQAIEPRPSDRYTTASKMLYALKYGHNTGHNNYISSHSPTTRATISLSPPPSRSQTSQPIYSPARTPVIREVNNPANGQKTTVIVISLLVSSLIVGFGISNRQPQPSAPVPTNSTVTTETQTPTVVLTNSPVAKEVSPTPVMTPTPSTEQQLISNALPKTNSSEVLTPPTVDEPVIQDTPTPTVRSTPEVEIQQQQSQPVVVPTAQLFSDSQKKPGKKRKELPEQLATNIRQSVPAFPTGTSRSSVEAALGKPKKDLRGLWSNTRAITYKVVPNQIDLGYLFDRDTGRIRQTEAAFASSVDNQVIQTTLNGLLAGQATAEIKQGLQQIQQRQIDNFKFTKGSVKGQIVRQNCDFIYISIWDVDLHDFVNPSDAKQC
jgi:serine/threonine-protein kinase